MCHRLFFALAACSALISSCISNDIPDVGQGYVSYSLFAPWHGKTDRTRFSCSSTYDRFFFNFEVCDSTLMLFDDFGKEMDVNDEDRVEIFFSPNSSLDKGYYCAEIDAAGHIMDYKAQLYRKFDYEWNFSDFKAEGKVTPWGYRVGGSVSRDELESLGIDLDGGFWMGVFRGDRIEDGTIEWYSIVPADVKEPDFHTPGVLFECMATPKIEKRGVVVYPDDISSVGLKEWEKRINLSGINLIGLHAATSNDPIDTLEKFIRSDIGQDFLALCEKKAVDVEYELHALEYLLPRKLYDSHPEYFRMDENGDRCCSYNMCFSNEDVIEAMRPQLETLLEWVKPSTHRYYFWADDKQGMFCHCESCSLLSPSEQILLYENRLLSMLREYDSEATLAHLAYQQTIDAPEALRAENGIFLEYAPIKRDYDIPLTVEQTTALKENLMAFPVSTQHILEYWLDESMFSHWKKDKPVPLPFKEEQAARDIARYRAFGASDFTCFATWLNSRYIENYGETDGIFVSYGKSFNSK